MSNVIYPAGGLSGSKKYDGITGTSVGSKNALDVNIAGQSSGGSLYTVYEAKTFTISGATTNTNIKTTQSMFGTVVTAKSVAVYSDIACTVKLNATGNNGIVLLAGEEKVIEGLDVTNLFITTTADTVIRVTLLG